MSNNRDFYDTCLKLQVEDSNKKDDHDKKDKTDKKGKK
jgi:hypothetical protein